MSPCHRIAGRQGLVERCFDAVSSSVPGLRRDFVTVPHHRCWPHALTTTEWPPKWESLWRTAIRKAHRAPRRSISLALTPATAYACSGEGGRGTRLQQCAVSPRGPLNVAAGSALCSLTTASRSGMDALMACLVIHSGTPISLCF